MNKTMTFDREQDNFPTLSFWKELPTKSTVFWQDTETGRIAEEIFSHVATDTVYFYNHDNCINQKFSYDSDSTLQDTGEFNEFPVSVELSDIEAKNYVLIPVQYFDQIVDDFKNGQIKLYQDYMDQGWGQVENVEYLYVETGDDTISYINGEGVWMLLEDMKKYDPEFEELFGMCLCEINENVDDE